MRKLVLHLITVLGISNVGGVQEFLRYYNGRHFSQYRDIPVNDCGFLLSNLGPYCENVTIFVPALQETLQGGSVQPIVEAYLIRENENVLAFQYHPEPTPFQVVISRIPDYGASLALAVECLVDVRIRPHLIGYGIGAHVAGQAGKILKNQGKILPRITGLDPAGLHFPSDYMLRKDFAEMVDVIHTDSGNLGSYAIMGTVDFIPNWGIASQPGCFEEKYLAQIENVTVYLENEFLRNPMVPPSITLCSHQRSYQFYAESILKEDSFLAVKKIGIPGCASRGDITTYMGLATPQSATGCYALNTKATCPYGNSHNPLTQRELDVLCNQK